MPRGHGLALTALAADGILLRSTEFITQSVFYLSRQGLFITDIGLGSFPQFSSTFSLYLKLLTFT